MHREKKEQVFELIVALLVLPLFWFVMSGCGRIPDYTTKHGIDVHDQTEHGIDQADIEEITRVALELWPAKLRNWRVTLRPEPCSWLDYDGWHETCGYSAEMHMCVWATKDPCFARTAFGHELLHAIHWEHHGTFGSHVDLKDLNQELWRRTVQGMCS